MPSEDSLGTHENNKKASRYKRARKQHCIPFDFRVIHSVYAVEFLQSCFCLYRSQTSSISWSNQQKQTMISWKCTHNGAQLYIALPCCADL